MTAVDPVAESRDWKAWEDHRPPGPVSFHVQGTVVVAGANHSARLAESRPQGINPNVLLLDLIVEEFGSARTDAITHLQVHYSEDRHSPGAYAEVAILRSGNGAAHIPRVDVIR